MLVHRPTPTSFWDDTTILEIATSPTNSDSSYFFEDITDLDILGSDPYLDSTDYPMLSETWISETFLSCEDKYVSESPKKRKRSDPTKIDTEDLATKRYKFNAAPAISSTVEFFKHPDAEFVDVSSEMRSILPSPEKNTTAKQHASPCVSPKALFTNVDTILNESICGDPSDMDGNSTIHLDMQKTIPREVRAELLRTLGTFSIDQRRQAVFVIKSVHRDFPVDIDLNLDLERTSDAIFKELHAFVQTCKKSSVSTQRARTKLRASSPKAAAKKPPSSRAPTKRNARKQKQVPLAPPQQAYWPKSLRKEETVIFKCEQVMTLANAEANDEDEDVDIL